MSRFKQILNKIGKWASKMFNITVLPAFLLILGVSGVLLFLNYKYSNEIIERQISDEYISIMSNKREAVNDMFDRILSVIYTSFSQDETMDIISGRISGYDKLLAMEKVNNYLLYSEGKGSEFDLFYYSHEGYNLQKGYLLFNNTGSFEETKWYKQAMESDDPLYWFGLNLHELQPGSYVFIGSLKIELSDYERGNMSGIAYFGISEVMLNEVCSNINGDMYLVDSNGRILYNSGERAYGEDIETILGSDIAAEIMNGNQYSVHNYETGLGPSTISIVSPRDKYGFSMIHVREEFTIIAKYKYFQILIYVLFAVFILAIIYYFILFAFKIGRPLQRIYNRISQGDARPVGNLISTGINDLDKEFNKILLENEENLLRINEIEKDEQLMELKKLQAEIDPHFIYNALTHIKFYAMLENPKQIISIIDALFFILKSKREQLYNFITVKNEIDILKKYIHIINIIYGDKIEFIFDINENIMESQIPSFILEPIVENCIHHGLNLDRPGNKVTISGKKDKKGIYFVITDNGDGIQEDALAKIVMYSKNSEGNATKHMGIMNIDKKIKLCCGEKYGISIKSKVSEGTAVTIHVSDLTQKTGISI